MTLTLLHDDTRRVAALLHRKRVCIDPLFRGECQWLFEDTKVRRTYYGKNGLTIDYVGEALYDAGLVGEWPTCDEVLELLARVFRSDPDGKVKDWRDYMGRGASASDCTRREAAEVLGVELEDLERQLKTRQGNRWRSYRCHCKRPVRVASDTYRATCGDCGEQFTLVTIKLDLSNVQIPATVDDVVPF